MKQGSFSFTILALSLLVGAVVTGVYAGPFFERPIASLDGHGDAMIVDPVIVGIEGEETFPVPVPARWLVDVIGVLEGGRAYAFERVDEPSAGMIYGYLDGEPKGEIEGYGTVQGLWEGTTCAYRNTVFRGNCVPELKIKRFEPLVDELP